MPRISIRLTDELLAALKELACENTRSVNEQAVHLFTRATREHRRRRNDEPLDSDARHAARETSP